MGHTFPAETQKLQFLKKCPNLVFPISVYARRIVNLSGALRLTISLFASPYQKAILGRWMLTVLKLRFQFFSHIKRPSQVFTRNFGIMRTHENQRINLNSLFRPVDLQILIQMHFLYLTDKNIMGRALAKAINPKIVMLFCNELLGIGVSNLSLTIM